MRARVDCDFISMERLSRGTPKPVIDPDLVVVDEAHHFRNTRTRRYAAVAELCYRSWVLLLSATPLQNRRDDLVAQLALFLGDAASTGTDDDLARLIVRQRAADATLPLPATGMLPLGGLMLYPTPLSTKLLLMVELSSGVRNASPPVFVLFVEIKPVGSAPVV